MNKSTAISILFALSAGWAGAQNLTVRVEVGAGQPVLQLNDVTHQGVFASSTNAVRFDLYVEAINGVPQPPSDPYLGFCVELNQQVTFGNSYDYTVVPIEVVNGGLIDAGRAARLAFLYDTIAGGTAPAFWPASADSAKGAAFQMAVWELASDNDLNLSDPTGTFFLGTQANPTAQNSLLLAQGWLDTISASNIQPGYTSTQWEIFGLANSANQDLLVARPVPEPGSLALLALAALPLLRRRRA